MNKIKVKLSFYSSEYVEDLGNFGFDCDWDELTEDEQIEVVSQIMQSIKDDTNFIVDIEKED